MAELGRRRWSRVLPALAAAAVLVQMVGLYRPAAPSVSWFPQADKLEHLLGFAVPVCLILLAAAFAPPRPKACKGPGGQAVRTSVRHRFVLVVVGIFALHAVVSELIQHFYYDNRTGDPFDVLADWSGVLLGCGVAQLVSRWSGVADRGSTAEVSVSR